MQEIESERKNILDGFLWKFLERISTQGVTFVISIILARLLLPEQYGIVAMVNVFIALANIFFTSGLNTALIQKKNADRLDFSTIFYCNIVLSIVLYASVFFLAPYIAAFFNMPELTLLTRVYGISLFLSAFSSVQFAYVARHMLFRKAFYVTTISTTMSGVIGIAMAYHGYGVWALVFQYLSSAAFSIIALCFIVKWYPHLMFSFIRAKELSAYGLRILISAFVGEFFLELRQLLIGRYYSAADLALYNRGKTFPALISSNIESTIGSVLFPAMSNHSDNIYEIKQITRRSIKTSSYLMFFLLTLLSVVADPLVRILLTDKWAECVPYMQLMCAAGMISIVSTANLQAIKAIGKSDIVLKLELYKKPVFLLLLILSVKISVFAVAMTLPIYAIYGTYINMKPNKQLLNYSIREQCGDILPQLFLAALMFFLVYPISHFGWNYYITITLQSILSLVIYLFGSMLLKIEAYQYCMELVKSNIRKNHV